MMDEIKERERGIIQIAQSIDEVNILAKDIQSLVHLQGDLINNIETHIERSREEVVSGVEQIQKAKEYQSVYTFGFGWEFVRYASEMNFIRSGILHQHKRNSDNTIN